MGPGGPPPGVGPAGPGFGPGGPPPNAEGMPPGAGGPGRGGACGQIRAACESAGFMRGAAREGTGLQSDCVIPLVQGTPQPKRASKPLPRVAPQLIAECRASNPSFAQPRNAAMQQPPPTRPVPGAAAPPVDNGRITAARIPASPPPPPPPPQDQEPCAQIASACESAGYSRAFVGSCIDPIMQGTAPPLRGRRPLPKVSPQLVADCKASDPLFGHPPSEAAAQPASAPAAAASRPNAPPAGKSGAGTGPNLEE
jgi:hypothetical protein